MKENNKGLTKIAVVMVVLVCLLVLYLVKTPCPFSTFLGVPCPGCGLSRSTDALLHLDFGVAFYYHPLVFILPPSLLYLLYRILLPTKKHLDILLEVSLIIMIALLFITVYFDRLLDPYSFLSVDFAQSLFNLN